MSNPKELPIPPIAERAKKAVEIARIWAADGAQHVSLAAGIWDDPAAWGLMFVDLAKHVANAHHESSGEPVDSVLRRIKEGFDAEWDTSTDESKGELLE